MEETLNPGSTISRSDTGIPAYYEKTVLRALPCNPSQLFVYWELPQPAASRCTGITLSLFEMESATDVNPLPLLEIPVERNIQSHYITIPFPGIAYTVVLTATFSDGNRTILHSTGTVQLPLPAPGLTPESVPAAKPVNNKFRTTTPNVFCEEITTMAVPPTPESPANPSSWAYREQQTP